MVRPLVLLAAVVVAFVMVISVHRCDAVGSSPALRMRPPGRAMAHIIYTLKQVR